MLMKTVLCAGVVAFAAAGAAGETRAAADAVTIHGADATMTVIPNAPAEGSAAQDADNAGLVTIFSSLASKYPKGVYWCCTGYNVMGSSSGVGEQWMGGAFTPDADHTLTKIAVAVGYSGQGPNAVVISLNEDKGGSPGKPLKTWNAANLPRFGTCCVTIVKTDRSGIALTGGRQYWVVLSTNSKEADTVDGWNVSDADQIDQANSASFDGSIWHTFQTAPGLAFAVMGSN